MATKKKPAPKDEPIVPAWLTMFAFPAVDVAKNSVSPPAAPAAVLPRFMMVALPPLAESLKFVTPAEPKNAFTKAAPTL